jgi:putative RNA 2'-phosphotransferase
MSNDLKQKSEFLSLVLRHDPGSVGLVLDPHGWANISDLVAVSPLPLTRNTVLEIIKSSDKQRFALSDDGERIRANQGHSIEVDLQLRPVAPPPALYHGTATRFLEAILTEGLSRQSRQHVHLSADTATATAVGTRHGNVVVLMIDSAAMMSAGHEFVLSANGVWLTNAVPPQFLSVMSD